MTIGERLRQERKRLQLTQAGVAASCGMCKPAISNYERGARSPDANLLAKLSDLGFDVAFVISGTNAPTTDGKTQPERPTPLTPRMANHLRMALVQSIAAKNKAKPPADREALSRVIAQIAAELGISYQP